MDRKLHQEPLFDTDTMRQRLDEWKSHKVSQVYIEWSTGTGPTVFYYPAGDRRFGVKWTAAVETFNYNEMYADFIEHTLLLRLNELINSRGLSAVIRCVDLQPLQVQRMRRRELERQQTAVAHH